MGSLRKFFRVYKNNRRRRGFLALAFAAFTAISGAIQANKQRKAAEKAAKNLPPLPDPAAEKIADTGSDERRRRLRKGVSGRKNTIVSGELSPKKVGAKSLLGR